MKWGTMRIMLALVAVLYSAAAFAQGTSPAAGQQGTPPATAQGSPPTVGGKPLVQVKPHGGAAKSASAKPAAGKPTSIAKKLLACSEIDDGTKGRLDCDDAIFPPKPNPKAPAAKGVGDCHFIKEEDERLNCYNGFADKIPKF
jgi:hypothetical protein